MIYLITGTPGSGKTLYAVSTLVQQLMATNLQKKGKEITRRLLVDGVNGLIIPHEKLTPGVEDDDGNLVAAPEGCGVWNWFEWCQPGDVIFIDEVQRWWRPRGMGTKPPAPIKHLETHRHLGIDFVVVTQNPMLLDQNIRRLVFRHQNIRRLFGMQRAAIYEWDSCAADVTRTKSSTMSFWNYPKKAFDLYVSSELHTKPKVKVPAWMALPVLALVGGLAIAPTAFGTLSGAMTGKGVGSAAKTAPAPSSPVVAALPAASVPVQPVRDLASDDQDVPATDKNEHFSGCIAIGQRCTCFDDRGRKVDQDAEMCTDLAQSKPLPADLLPDPPKPRLPNADDVETLAFLQSNRPGRAHYVPDGR